MVAKTKINVSMKAPYIQKNPPKKNLRGIDKLMSMPGFAVAVLFIRIYKNITKARVGRVTDIGPTALFAKGIFISAEGYFVAGF